MRTIVCTEYGNRWPSILGLIHHREFHGSILGFVVFVVKPIKLSLRNRDPYLFFY
jgi:hypothetical protein